MMSLHLSFRRSCKAFISFDGILDGSGRALLRTSETCAVTVSFFSAESSDMLLSTAATISATGIFFGAMAKFIPFCNADSSVSVSGLFEMFKTYFLQSMVFLVNGQFDFSSSAANFFACALFILKCSFHCKPLNNASVRLRSSGSMFAHRNSVCLSFS